MQPFAASVTPFLIVVLAAAIPKCGAKPPPREDRIEPIAPALGPPPESPGLRSLDPPRPPPADLTIEDSAFVNARSISLDQGSASAVETTPPSVTTIAFRRTECVGTCPAYTVTAHSNGAVGYYGKAHVKTKGAKTWKVAPSKVTALANAFVKAGFFTTSYQPKASLPDRAYVVMQVTHGGKRRTIVDYTGAEGALPADLRQLEDEVDKRLNTTPMVQCKGACP